MATTLTALNYFLPIISFLLVFVIVYALLAKTKVLGENQAVNLLISFLLAIFFILQVSLVDFVQFSAAWFAVFLVCIVLIAIFLSFTGGWEKIFGNKYVAWFILAALIIFFIISSAYTFNWAVNWDKIYSWLFTDWFGFILLLIIAAIVSWVIAKK